MGIHLSVATIKRARRKLGWKWCGPHYCQMVRETNHIARLAFMQECLERRENFDNVIFTDESSTSRRFCKMSFFPSLSVPFQMGIVSSRTTIRNTKLCLHLKKILRNQPLKSNGFIIFIGKLAMQFIKDNKINYWLKPSAEIKCCGNGFDKLLHCTCSSLISILQLFNLF